ncbi:MAG TPA: toll/interleukin-1 receptor domain-containing protein [Kofleriaceae bacterium]
MSYVFFASYARCDDNKFSRMHSVIELLEERVRSLRGGASTQIAFVDVASIQTGDDWQNRLSTAVHEAYVLVCMMSASYFSSEWCAREFAVFRRRLELLGSQAPGVIIPVIWDIGTIPRAIAKYQYDNERFPKQYAAEGLRTLRSVKKRRDAYLLTIDELARRIHEAAAHALPALAPPMPFDALPRAFDNPGRYNLAMVVLHPRGPQWLIDAAAGKTLAERVDAVAASLGVPWRDVTLDGGLCAEIQRAVKHDRAAIVVVTDEQTAAMPPFAGHVAALDGCSLPPLAVLVAANDDGAPRRLFPTLASTSPRVLLDTFTLGGSAALETKLGRLAEKLRMALLAEDPVTKVEDAALQEGAARAGISIATQPMLAGPGGRS